MVEKVSEVSRTKKVAFIALFTVLIAVGAQISIPVGTVPITLQMLFIFLAGFLLEPFDALLSLGLYLIMGAIGLPVFANLSGGLSHLFGPTAGYLYAFPISAFVIAFLRKKVNPYIAGAVGLAIVYLLGWFLLGLRIHSFQKAFLVGVAPFILVDAVKMVVAVVISKKLEKILG